MFLFDFRGTQGRFPPKYIENTFLAIQSRCGSIEMHSKRRYKICICLVILEELESFLNYKGFSIIFPKILHTIQRITKVKIIFESEYLRLPFCYEN